MDVNQAGRYSKSEMEFIRSTFGGDSKLLYQLRDVFLQLDEELIELSPEIIKFLRKSMLPDLDNDVPLLQQADIYFSLGKIKELNPGSASLLISSKDLQREYLEQIFQQLSGEVPAEEVIVLTKLKEKGTKTEEERLISMIAYLDILSYVDSRLNELKILALSKDETPEEVEKKAKMNTSK